MHGGPSMSKALSTDLRTRVVEAYGRGEGTQRELGKRFGVGEAWVRRWWRRWREAQTVEPRRRPGSKPKVGAAGLEVLLQLVKATPDATRDELADNLFDRVGVRVSVATVGRMLVRLGWTRKKASSSL